MKKLLSSVIALTLGLSAFAADAVKQNQETETKLVPTVAVLSFDARTRTGESNGDGKSIADLVMVALLESGSAELVERAELDKALTELHLSQIGLVDKESQLKLGKLIGARILVAGSAFRSGDKNFLVAKVIGTETSRVFGCSVSGNGDFAAMTTELSKKIDKIIRESTGKLLPEKMNETTALTALSGSVKGNGRTVYLKIGEDIREQASDPAAETELKKLLLSLGFQVIDDRSAADFALIGEAVSSQTGSYKQFTGASARVELSLFGKDKKLLATASVKNTIAGATYLIAAKDAIAQSALTLAVELFPVMK